jgi:uncharacterized protein
MNGAIVRDGSTIGLKVQVSDDGMDAFLVLSEGPEGLLPSRDEIALLLQENHVISGIREEKIDEIAQGAAREAKVLIAEGKRPSQGKDGWIEYRFNGHSTTPASEKEERVDHHELGWIHNILKSETIAVIHPAEDGSAGETVLGTVVAPKAVKTPSPKLGHCVAVAPDDQLRLIATEDGNAVMHPDGTFEVETVLTIRKNIDYSTGNIDFVGSVIITGDVKADFTVKARKSIEIQGNVEDATIVSGGDVTIRNGFIGQGKGTCVAAGNVTIHHVLNQKVTSDADITIVREAVCAKLRASNKIIAPTAVFVGCILEAGREIEVCNLGNGEEGQSRARVGRRGILLERMTQLEKDMVTVQKQIVDVKDTVYKLVRLQLDKGVLSPEQQQLNGKLRSLQPELQRRLEQLQKDKENLRVELEKESLARIIVRDTLFPNVSIELNGLRKLNLNALKEVILVESGGKIEEKSID